MLPVTVYLGRLAKSSQRVMRYALDRVAAILSPDADAATLPWHSVRYEHMQGVRAKLIATMTTDGEPIAPATANLWLLAVKGVLQEAWRLGLMGVEDYHRAIDVKRIKGERAPAGRMITAEELKALFATCPDTAIGRRDVAILAIMYGCGLRRHEVVGLNLESFSGEHIRFIGKGNKEQVRPLPIWVRSCVRGWLQHRGEKPGALFYAYRRGNHMELDAAGNPIRLAEGSLYGMLKERVGKAGIKISLSPHDFRRTVISNMLAAGDDAHSVQLFIGHANIATTLRYDRRGEEAVEAVAAKIKDPR